MAEHEVRLGIDLGGTKTEIIALGPDGAALQRRRVATPHADYGALLACLCDLVRAADAQFGGHASVGVGIPGALSQVDGRVKNANSSVLIGKPLKEDLEHVLGCEVRIANDANCFALSEATDGAAAGAGVVFGVILGTGVGGGVSNIDRLYERVPELWLEHIFSDRVVTRLKRNRHGDSSGVRGAAWL